MRRVENVHLLWGHFTTGTTRKTTNIGDAPVFRSAACSQTSNLEVAAVSRAGCTRKWCQINSADSLLSTNAYTYFSTTHTC